MVGVWYRQCVSGRVCTGCVWCDGCVCLVWIVYVDRYGVHHGGVRCSGVYEVDNVCAYVQCKDGLCVVWWRARVVCVYVVEDA